jgi:transcription antitermination factor NusA-like protein
VDQVDQVVGQEIARIQIMVKHLQPLKVMATKVVILQSKVTTEQLVTQAMEMPQVLAVVELRLQAHKVLQQVVGEMVVQAQMLILHGLLQHQLA